VELEGARVTVVQVLFTSGLHVPYGQVYVQSGVESPQADLRDAFAGQVNGLCGAATTGSAAGIPQIGGDRSVAVQRAPGPATFGPMVRVELERIEALELLAMTLAHLKDAESRGEMSPRVPLLMAIRDKLAAALREES
jgi:hypothetical protein